MSVFSLKPNSRKQIRSMSLPCRSHPTTDRIEKELNKAKTWKSTSWLKPSAESIWSGLSQLSELYKCMDDLLKSSPTQELISKNKNEKWVDQLMEVSVKFLDICRATSDAMSQVKEHLRDLQCALRRRKGDFSIERTIAKFKFFRKKLRKDTKGSMASLKQVDNTIHHGSLAADSENHHLMAVIKVAVEIGTLSVSIFHSLLFFLAAPVSKTKLAIGWSAVSGLISIKDKVAPKEKAVNMNEMQSLDAALGGYAYGTNGEEEIIRIIQKRLEALDFCMKRIESGVDSTCRRLISARASLLNIVSSY